MKATEEYFPVVLSICLPASRVSFDLPRKIMPSKMVLTFDSVYEGVTIQMKAM